MLDELRRMALFGSGVAELTRYRAEQVVKDLVKAGDLRREQASTAVKEMLDMARSNRKDLLDLVRGEIRDQVTNLGLASRRDVERLERRVARLEDELRKLRTGPRTGSTATKKAVTRKTAAKTSQTSKKTPAGRTPAVGKPADTGAGE